VARAAQVLWDAAGQIGAKRLQPFVPALLDRLAACGELILSAATATALRQVSTATLERLLAPARQLAPRRGRSTTQPGGWLKHQIPIRTFAQWDDARPGFLEVDLVAHCGEDGGGFFLHTLCAVDVATGWVELQPVWGTPGGPIDHRARAAVPFAPYEKARDEDEGFYQGQARGQAERRPLRRQGDAGLLAGRLLHAAAAQERRLAAVPLPGLVGRQAPVGLVAGAPAATGAEDRPPQPRAGPVTL